MVGPCSESFSDSVALLAVSVATGMYRHNFPGRTFTCKRHGPFRGAHSNPCFHIAARFCQRIKDLRRVESTSMGRGQKSYDRCCSERTKRCEVTYSYASIGERRYDALAA